MKILKNDHNSRTSGSKLQKYSAGNEHTGITSSESQETILGASETQDGTRGGLENGMILKTIQIDVHRTETHDAKSPKDPKTFFESS
jgi:hypothetical protein